MELILFKAPLKELFLYLCFRFLLLPAAFYLAEQCGSFRFGKGPVAYWQNVLFAVVQLQGHFSDFLSVKSNQQTKQNKTKKQTQKKPKPTNHPTKQKQKTKNNWNAKSRINIYRHFFFISVIFFLTFIDVSKHIWLYNCIPNNIFFLQTD